MKAKSRLRTDFAPIARPPLTTPSITPPPRLPNTARSRRGATILTLPNLDLSWLLPVILSFLPHWHFLAVSLLGMFLSGYVLTNVQPQAIQHWLFPNSYFPLLLSVCLTVWGLGSFLLKNALRGVLVSAALITLLFLKLQKVEVPALLVVAILVFFGTIGICAYLIQTALHQTRRTHHSSARHAAR